MRPSYTLGGNVHWYSHHGKQCGDCFKSWEFDPAIPLLSTHTKETRNERDTCTPMFIATLFTIARTWKQLRCPLADEWIRELWYTDSMEYSVQFSSVTQSCPTLCDPMDWSMPGSLFITNSQSLFTLMSIKFVIQSYHLILCLSLLLLPSISPRIRVFSNESVHLIRCPKYWSFSFSISPSKEYSGLISFRIDWVDLFAVQGTLKSLLQHHTSKALILWRSTFFIVQLSQPNMTTRKTIALTRCAFAGKTMFLPFNMLSRFVTTFLPRNKHILIPWVLSSSAVILKPKKTKYITVSIVSSSI